MTTKRSKRSPDQQLALERKLGLALLGGLFVLFCAVLSAKVGGFGWDKKTVEVNLGGTTSSNGVPSDRPSTSMAGSPTRSHSPYAPPQVYLPPAPPPVVGRYPLPNKPTPPSIAVAPPQVPTPFVSVSVPPVGDRYAQTNVVAQASPKPQVLSNVAPPSAVIPAIPTQREPGVAAIGLVAGNEPIAPIRTSPPAVVQTMTSSHSPRTHVFAAGENLWLIAQKAYGDGAYYRALFAFNQDRYPHPEDLRPGDKLDVPSVTELQSKFPQLCPAPTATIQR